MFPENRGNQLSFAHSAKLTPNYNVTRSGGGLFAFTSFPPLGFGRLLHALFPLLALFVKLDLVRPYVQHS